MGRLWGRPSSVNVQKVMWALAELDVPFEQVALGGRYGGLDMPEFRALSPLPRVPVWQDGGFVLWESHAIVRHLAAKAGRLGPGPVGDQWMEFTTTTAQPPFIAVFYQTVRLPPSERNPDVLAAELSRLDAALAVMDAHLQRQAWLGGAAFSVADIAAGAMMYRLGQIGVPRPVLPGVARWVEALEARAAYRACVMTDYSELAG